MKLFKVDTAQWTVREVVGEPWPGRDAEGDVCYTNTHFERAEEAWRKLELEALAGIRLSQRRIVDLLSDVDELKAQLPVYDEALRRVAQARGEAPGGIPSTVAADPRDELVKLLLRGLTAPGESAKQWVLEQVFRGLCEDSYVNRARAAVGWSPGQAPD